MRTKEEILTKLRKEEVSGADANTDMTQVYQNRVIIELLLDIREKLSKN